MQKPDMIPVPIDVSREVDQYADREIRDAEKYVNRTPLDESGINGLHDLVALAYARGYQDGVIVQDARGSYRKQRDADRARLRDTEALAREQREARAAAERSEGPDF